MFFPKRHSLDQCSAEQSRARPDHVTPTKVRASPRGLSLSKLNLKGASETTVKILLQRKHQRGEAKTNKQQKKKFDFGDVTPAAGRSDVFPLPQRVYTMAGPTLMETCGTPFWGRSWNASFALVLTVTKAANASPAPPSTRASILWNQQGSAARRVQVIRPGSPRRRTSSIRLICLFPVSAESKAEANQTLCYPGDKNKLLVYKVESSLRVDPPNTVRIIAVERRRTSEVEVQVWKSVEGA